MKNILVLAFALLFIRQTGYTGDNLTAELSLNKSEFVEGEEVWASVVIRNTGTKTDSIANLDEFEVTTNIQIKNSNGVKSKYKGVIGCTFIKIFTVFKPGDSCSYSIPLQDVYGFEMETPRMEIFAPENYFPEDSYSVQFWKSEKKFKVSKPAGNDSIARAELRAVFSMSSEKSEIDKKIRAYQNFVDRNPGCIYTELAFAQYSSARTFRLGNLLLDEDFVNYCKWFIGKFPDSYYSYSIIWETAYAIGKITNNKYSILNFLQDVISKYPGTRASEAAGKLLTHDFLK